MAMSTLKRGAAALMAIVAGTASADISTTIFTITAEAPGNAPMTWSAEINVDDIDPSGNYNWTLPEAVEMRNAQNELIFRLESASLGIIADPVVSLNFGVVAGMQNTVFTISSANLSFSPIASATGRATAGFSAVDQNGDGVTFTPWAGGAYTSQYNAASSTFQNLINAPLSTPVPFGVVDSNEAFPVAGFAPIAGAVSDIESAWRFTLSAGDFASGTSAFEVVPAPASAALLGLGVIAAGRRRR